MKTIYKNIALAALALGAAACSQEDDFSPSFLNDPDAVRITAQVGTDDVIGGFTRSNPIGTVDEQKEFNTGDRISVTAESQEPVIYQLGNDGWVPVGDTYLKWQTNEMNVIAYYPVDRNDASATTFTVPTECTDLAAMADADYMIYSGTQTKGDDKAINLTMERKMVRIVVDEISFNDQFAENYSVTAIKVHANTTGYADGEPVEGNIEVSAFAKDDDFYALLAPTTEDKNATFLTVTVAHKTNSEDTHTLTVKGIPATVAGNSYNYSLTVGKDKVGIGSVSVKPWTTDVIDGGEAEEIIPIPYLTFTADAEQTMTMEISGSYTLDESLQYSVNGGGWTQLTANTGITFGGTNGNLRLRGKSSTGTASSSSSYAEVSFGNPYVQVACSGDIRTLVDYENYTTTNTADARFCYLFYYCPSLTVAPELPAETLAEGCYQGMFSSCTSLTVAPELPAETLAEGCYQSMFYGCTSLTAAPELPATALAKNCYLSMFGDCDGLTAAPELPATTLAEGCYQGMFGICDNLTVAPELPATTLAEGCYQSMFANSPNLNEITMLATDISATDCLKNWVYGVASTGTFIKAATMISLTTGEHGIPAGWTVEDKE